MDWSHSASSPLTPWANFIVFIWPFFNYLLVDQPVIYLLIRRSTFHRVRIWKCCLDKWGQPECLLVADSHVFNFVRAQVAKIEGQVLQLYILRVVIEWQDGDAVQHIKTKAQGWVVDTYHVGQLSVLDDSQVFDQSVLGLYAILSVQPVREYFIFRVNEVQNCISVQLVTGCERHQLKLILKSVQALQQSRPQVYLHL